MDQQLTRGLLGILLGLSKRKGKLKGKVIHSLEKILYGKDNQ
jgi:hypothetical protein